MGRKSKAQLEAEAAANAVRHAAPSGSENAAMVTPAGPSNASSSTISKNDIPNAPPRIKHRGGRPKKNVTSVAQNSDATGTAEAPKATAAAPEHAPPSQQPQHPRLQEKAGHNNNDNAQGDTSAHKTVAASSGAAAQALASNSGGGASASATATEGAPFSLVIYRHYNPPRDKNDEVTPGARRMNQYAEALLHKVLSMDTVPSLIMAMNGEWILHKEGRRIKLCNDVYLTITRNDRSDWDVNALELTLTSAKKSATQLVKYVEQLYDDYVNYLNNSLRGNIYFFDHKEIYDFRGNPFDGTSPTCQKKFDIMNAPRHLSFQQLPFHSNKTFDNLCGPEAALIAERVDRFMKGKEKYDEKGVPWQLGFMFSGESGSGKSSCIRAMANHTGRHIINVNFANIKTVTQLKTLFYSEYINVYRDDESRDTMRLRVPIDKRIFVMEEIDALGKTIIERRGRCHDDSAVLQDDGEEAGAIHDEITLGDLLQVLDGNMETPGRIIVITSNQPDILDEALIRPGRININVRFGLASRSTVAEMYHKLHDEPLHPELLADVPDGQLSPAEVMEVMFRSFGVQNKENADRDVVCELKRRGESAAADRQRRADSVRQHVQELAFKLQRQQQLAHHDDTVVPALQGAADSHSGKRIIPSKRENCAGGDEEEGEITYDDFVKACGNSAWSSKRGGNA